jgi:hypothetical protein
MRPRDLSPIELAKQVRALKAITTSDKEFVGALRALGVPEIDPRLSKILDGLNHEDEFALLCRLMETCDSINSIGQTPVVANDQQAAPDFIAIFRPALSWIGGVSFPPNSFYRCMIEVKGTSKVKHGFSRKDLTRRLTFAERFGVPLVLAIRFTRFASLDYS